MIDHPSSATQAERPPQEFPTFATRLEPAEDGQVRCLAPDRVPYITRWSAEKGWRGKVVQQQHGGIGYADEMPWDRDERGVLWARMPSRPGQGRPQFGEVHGQRQRRAMRRLLCQVCGQPADRTPDGLLWLVGEDPYNPESWPNPLLTSHPPVCRGCAARSVRVCPHLRIQHVALRVRTFVLVGVRGALYRPGDPDPVVASAVQVTFDNPCIGWVKAGQLIASLRDFTATELSVGTRS